MLHIRPHHHRQGMTLLEVLVTIVILLSLTALCFRINSHMSDVVGRNQELARMNRDGEMAMALITEHLSRATLFSQTQFVTPTARIIGDEAPGDLGPNSRLVFVSVPGSALGLPVGTIVTHGIFFQSALGEDPGQEPSSSLKNALNEIGYFVQVNDGNAPMIVKAPPVRPRLMQFRRWPREFQVYRLGEDPQAGAYEWFGADLVQGRNVEPVISNVLALIITPKVRSTSAPASEQEVSITRLVPQSSYIFDSTTTAIFPDALEITLVVAGEQSLQRYAKANPGTNFDFGQYSSFTGNPQTRDAELAAFLGELEKNKINYKVFSATQSLKGWRRW